MLDFKIPQHFTLSLFIYIPQLLQVSLYIYIRQPGAERDIQIQKEKDVNFC